MVHILQYILKQRSFIWHVFATVSGTIPIFKIRRKQEKVNQHFHKLSPKNLNSTLRRGFSLPHRRKIIKSNIKNRITLQKNTSVQMCYFR
jgi:hypothetical protein